MKKLVCIFSAFLLISSACSTQKNFKWNKEANQKAKQLGLSKDKVKILASLVEKETKVTEEKPKIARVYLNRLNKDMYLQSDPSVLFAVGDPNLKRILKSHLETDSPYNTYKNKGLPPGPICEPGKESISAVLNAAPGNYLYFCAKPDFSGGFNYAETMREHMENVKLLTKAMGQGKVRQE